MKDMAFKTEDASVRRRRLGSLLESAWKGLNSATCTWVLLALTVLLYLGTVSGHWYPLPDSALYRSLAESLSSGRGYTYWSDVPSHALPGFPLLLAGCIKLGLKEPWQLNVVMVLLSLGLCWTLWAVTWVLVRAWQK